MEVFPTPPLPPTKMTGVVSALLIPVRLDCSLSRTISAISSISGVRENNLLELMVGTKKDVRISNELGVQNAHDMGSTSSGKERSNKLAPRNKNSAGAILFGLAGETSIARRSLCIDRVPLRRGLVLPSAMKTPLFKLV